MKRWVRVTAFAAAAIWLVGCATPNLNPAQERAYAAFKDCQTLSPPRSSARSPKPGGSRSRPARATISG